MQNLWRFSLTRTTDIGAHAFEETSLCGDMSEAVTNWLVTIPEGVTNIGDYAFSNCKNLRRIYLPTTLQHIGAQAFYGCANLEAVDTIWGLPNVPAGLFQGCKKLKSIRISGKTLAVPKGVPTIGARAFKGCSSLSKIDMSVGSTPASKTIQIIGDNAFLDCTSLTSFTIPSTVTLIGKTAFSGCSGLTSMTIPSGVKSLGDSAFKGCSKLEKVTISGNITNSYSGEGRPFEGCTKLSEVTFNGKAGKVPAYCFWKVSTLKKATLGSSMKAIEANAFRACTNLATLTIPESVTSIGETAFLSCAKFSDLLIPKNVTSVGANFVQGCAGLKKLRVPETWKGTAKITNSGVPSGCTIVYYALGTLQTVSFRGNGGEPALQTNTYTIGNAYGTLPTPTRDGYAFAGWWNDPTNGAETASTTIVPNLSARTLFAHWTPCTQTVTFDGNGGNAATETGAYTVGTAYANLPGASREGWAFTGWWTDPVGGTQVADGDTVSTDLERALYAQWRLLATTTTPEPVPCEWIESNAPEILAAADGDHEAAANAKAANGRPVWECYVADVSVTNAAEDFKTVLVLEDGQWVPKPSPDRGSARAYTVQGAAELGDESAWGPVTDDSRFFRVKVSLPE